MTWSTSSIRIQLQWFQQSCSPYSLEVHMRSAWNCHRQIISSAVHYCWCHTEVKTIPNLFINVITTTVQVHKVKWCHTLRGICERHGQLGTGGTDVFLASLNISDLFNCPFITGVASFRYEIDISLPLVGVRRNRRTIKSVSSQSTTVTLALYSMSRRSEGLSGQATRSALTVS